MVEQFTSDVRTLLDRNPFDQNTVADIREALSRDPSRYTTLRDAIQNLRDRNKETPSEDLLQRLGVAYTLMGQHSHALECLNQIKDSGAGIVHYFRGIALENQQKWSDASKAFTASAAASYDVRNSRLHEAGCYRRMSQPEKTKAILDEMAGLETAEYFYQKGSLLASEGHLIEAAEELEKSLQLDRYHTGALFELAYINDLFGNDDKAIDFYKQCVQRPPVPVSALINLGILYEDEKNFREAEKCYRQVLSIMPTHQRAKLFLRDCLASLSEVIDDGAERDLQATISVFGTPVTDFELSVRSRNCLRKMNIRTLGDLTRITENALLSSKNFGETSLNEIKEMMTSKKLRLGMALESPKAGTERHAEPQEELSAEEKALLSQPLSVLNLSVRARKCMTKLNIATLGELVSMTGDKLMECKNFGVTSLNEVREKLTSLNLKLRND
ncbi:MAG: hypothetical protein RJA81_269 [Planctomycetota bacterium]